LRQRKQSSTRLKDNRTPTTTRRRRAEGGEAHGGQCGAVRPDAKLRSRQYQYRGRDRQSQADRWRWDSRLQTLEPVLAYRSGRRQPGHRFACIRTRYGANQGVARPIRCPATILQIDSIARKDRDYSTFSSCDNSSSYVALPSRIEPLGRSTSWPAKDPRVLRHPDALDESCAPFRRPASTPIACHDARDRGSERKRRRARDRITFIRSSSGSRRCSPAI